MKPTDWSMGYFTGWPCLILKCSEDNFASVANITFPDFDLDAGVAARLFFHLRPPLNH